MWPIYPYFQALNAVSNKSGMPSTIIHILSSISPLRFSKILSSCPYYIYQIPTSQLLENRLNSLLRSRSRSSRHHASTG